MIVLPRQARDKHQKHHSKKRCVFLQTFHSMQMFITVTTYLRGTRILAEQQEDAAAAAAGVAGAGAVGVQLEPRSLALFQQLCTDLFRGMFGLAGMGNAFGTAAGDVAAVEVRNLLPAF